MTKLTLHDRCDACGAAAYVRVTSPEPDNHTLDWCGNHWRRFAAHIPTDWRLHSELRRLDEEHGPNRVRPEAHA